MDFDQFLIRVVKRCNREIKERPNSKNQETLNTIKGGVVKLRKNKQIETFGTI